MSSDVLMVSFDGGSNDESALCVTRKCGEKTIVLKMELGKQAEILYHLLTGPTTNDVMEAMFKAIAEKSKELEKYLTPPPEPVKFEEDFIPSVNCECCFEKERKNDKN